MFTCNECKRTFSKRSSLRNHSKTHAADHIDEQMRIATEELKKSNEEVRYSPAQYSLIQYSPIITDIIEEINDREYDDDDISSDEILGTDIISDDKYNEVNNLFNLLFVNNNMNVLLCTN